MISDYASAPPTGDQPSSVEASAHGTSTSADPSLIARAYDVGLGGKDHFEADQVGFNKLLELAPRLPVARSAT
ncbi:hypothetical protein [Nonomuraea sp. NPDC049695]|uniref:hypothetical protein n=1 Tax=Nonomuraea sp. NPDC049695 TaxID=3154734 RepID=UPI0034392695